MGIWKHRFVLIGDFNYSITHWPLLHEDSCSLDTRQFYDYLDVNIHCLSAFWLGKMWYSISSLQMSQIWWAILQSWVHLVPVITMPCYGSYQFHPYRSSQSDPFMTTRRRRGGNQAVSANGELGGSSCQHSPGFFLMWKANMSHWRISVWGKQNQRGCHTRSESSRSQAYRSSDRPACVMMNKLASKAVMETR